jgi:exosortase/archaeosortase family protein
MVAIVLPMTLFTNAVRLMLILVSGAYHSEALATWVHHNEGPVLILFCSIGLMGIRYLIIKWTQPRPLSEESLAVEAQAVTG